MEGFPTTIDGFWEMWQKTCQEVPEGKMDFDFDFDFIHPKGDTEQELMVLRGFSVKSDGTWRHGEVPFELEKLFSQGSSRYLSCKT